MNSSSENQNKFCKKCNSLKSIDNFTFSNLLNTYFKKCNSCLGLNDSPKITDNHYCSKCKTLKPITRFTNNPNSPTGLSYTCKTCEMMRARELRNTKERAELEELMLLISNLKINQQTTQH